MPVCALLIGAVYSCKDPGSAGLEVLPTSDQVAVRFSDTASIVCYSIREDSLTSSNNSANLAGYYNDPVFGICRAGFFAQLAPLTNSPNFGVEPVADSVILSLQYSGSYGDTTVGATDQIFHVYQVTQDLYKDSTYYSNDSISYGSLISSGNYAINTKDSVLVNGIREAPQLRLMMDTSFFRTYLLNQSGQATLSSVSAFQAYFKGIYVTPDPASTAGNRILYFNLASSITRLHVYYHNATDTGVYDLEINAKNTCATVNHFYHNYSGTQVELQLTDTTLGGSNIYIQAMAGVKAKLRIPYLRNFLSIGRIAINKAELVISVDQPSVMGYHPIGQLAVQGIDSAGKSIFTADYFESIDFRGGNYDQSTLQYKTNITRYIQRVLSGQVTDNGIYLVVYGGSVFANRSVLRGYQTAEKIKLNLTYSLLN